MSDIQNIRRMVERGLKMAQANPPQSEYIDCFQHILDEYGLLDIAKEIEQLQQQLTDAMREASGLALALYNQHYKTESPEFKLCDSVAGIITQIDNMSAGLSEQITDKDKRIDELEGALDFLLTEIDFAYNNDKPVLIYSGKLDEVRAIAKGESNGGDS